MFILIIKVCGGGVANRGISAFWSVTAKIFDTCHIKDRCRLTRDDLSSATFLSQPKTSSGGDIGVVAKRGTLKMLDICLTLAATSIQNTQKRKCRIAARFSLPGGAV